MTTTRYVNDNDTGTMVGVGTRYQVGSSTWYQVPQYRNAVVAFARNYENNCYFCARRTVKRSTLPVIQINVRDSFKRRLGAVDSVGLIERRTDSAPSKPTKI